jgi:hypothetical protein
MDKEQLRAVNRALAQERACRIRCAAASWAKEVAENEKRQAEALEDRLVYETVAGIVEAEQRRQKKLSSFKE